MTYFKLVIATYSSIQVYMMNYLKIVLNSLMLLLVVDIIMLVNSRKVKTRRSNCSQKIISSNSSLYFHSAVFTENAVPKNVEIFKYHCTMNLTFSTVNALVSFSI